ncbi:MAG: hypothetical protein ACK5KN_16730 [Dysgonomonas sp.]|uniref:hypothetical protein n=1 Tax=Dysgonomonas sp. TaxID=1891233 RepID=UPI003A897082
MDLNLVSFFARYYLDICERIRTEVPEIEWIEQDFGQDVFDKWRPNVAFPAVLIDFPAASYDAEAATSQFGEVTMSVRLLVAPFTQSYEEAPIEVKEDALQYFEIEQKLINALHGWQPEDEYCQPLVRSSIQSNNRNDIGLRIRNLAFTTAYEEDFE